MRPKGVARHPDARRAPEDRRSIGRCELVLIGVRQGLGVDGRRYQNAILALPALDPHAAANGVLDRVADQIAKHPSKLHRVRRDRERRQHGQRPYGPRGMPRAMLFLAASKLMTNLPVRNSH